MTGFSASAFVVAPNNTPVQPCQAIITQAVNNVSNLNVNAGNVTGGSFINGAWNYNFAVPGASPSSLPAGRYPLTGLNQWTGIGPSLHIPPFPTSPTSDPSVYGMNGSTFTFTAHMDSAYATPFTPIGALIHWIVDVTGHGGHRPPC